MAAAPRLTLLVVEEIVSFKDIIYRTLYRQLSLSLVNDAFIPNSFSLFVLCLVVPHRMRAMSISDAMISTSMHCLVGMRVGSPW